METKQAKLTPQFGQHGSIEKLYIDDEQIAKLWGIETAEALSFFSLETGGWQTQISARTTIQENPDHHNTSFTVNMRESQWQGTVDEFVQDNVLIRQFDYQALTTCWAMDLVMRFVFKKEAVQFAEIGGKRIEWDGANIYHQFPTDHVDLQLHNTAIRIAAQNLQFSLKWKSVMYVRCSPVEDAWVIHLRLLPQTWDKEIFKVRLIKSKHIVLPNFITQPILHIPKIANHLRYAGEFKRANLGRLNIYPLIKIAKDETFHLEARIFCHEIA